VARDRIKDSLRKLPGVDRMLEVSAGKKFIDEHGKPAATSALRRAIDIVRRRIMDEDDLFLYADSATIEVAIFNMAASCLHPRLAPLINATGVVIHTNLGRAPLAAEAIEAMNSVTPAYSNLEYDIEKGERGSRQSLVDELIVELIGSEAAMVVNNNAGAVFLALIALARDREVIVSRGELVEIGGSFRVPDVMAASGAIMVEVGTTNKTRADDYAAAVGDKTAALLKVHRSNFYIRGFTQEAKVEQLAATASEKNLHLIVDLGSGCLVDTAKWGLPHEPTPQETLGQGAHIVSFSGDKLLGGPQAGIIAGRRDVIETLKKHPVHRALRVDKGTLAALEATLRLYIAGRAEESVPVLKMISLDSAELKRRARSLAKSLGKKLEKAGAAGFRLQVVECTGKVGGGALADADLPSWAVAVDHPDIKPEEIFDAMLHESTPVVGRIQDDLLLLDVRTLWNVDTQSLCKTVASAIKSLIEKHSAT